MSLFLSDIVDILASYFFDKSVDLYNIQLYSGTEENELQLFHAEINLRHDIAYGRSLSHFFDEITKNISGRPQKWKTESTLPLRGELDINRYLQNRSDRLNKKRLHPVIRTSSVPNTPENILIKSCLVLLMRQLIQYRLKESAELVAAQQLLNWLHIRLSSWPWDLVLTSNNIERTYLETKKRVIKRQTGNNLGYTQFLSWFEEWRISFHKPGKIQEQKLLSHLLAFPAGDSFNERVFEIWCMKFLSKNLHSLGFELVNGPKPLHKKDAEPVYTFNRGGRKVYIWFQKQAPIGKPHWVYTDNNRNLRGIPDIILTCEDFGAPLVIDAKLRSYSRSQSEEIYKMLGYYENFRKSLGKNLFFGVLLFVSEKHQVHELQNSDGSMISVMSVPEDIHCSKLAATLARIIEQWLADRGNSQL